MTDLLDKLAVAKAGSGMFPIMVNDSHRGGHSTISQVRKSGGLVVVAVPWSMLEPHEAQAQRNHSQSLQRLAERGGLSACEALAVLQDREYRSMTAADANAQLVTMLLKDSAHD